MEESGALNVSVAARSAPSQAPLLLALLHALAHALHCVCAQLPHAFFGFLAFFFFFFLPPFLLLKEKCAEDERACE